MRHNVQGIHNVYGISIYLQTHEKHVQAYITQKHRPYILGGDWVETHVQQKIIDRTFWVETGQRLMYSRKTQTVHTGWRLGRDLCIAEKHRLYILGEDWVETYVQQKNIDRTYWVETGKRLMYSRKTQTVHSGWRLGRDLCIAENHRPYILGGDWVETYVQQKNIDLTILNK